MHRTAALLFVIFWINLPSHAQTQANCQFKIFSAPQGLIGVAPSGINDYGNIVGMGIDINGGAWGVVRYKDGTWKIYRPPQGGETTFNARNNSGVIVGFYEGVPGQGHGLVLYGSKLQTVDYPGSSWTVLTGINRYGTIVGIYTTSDGIQHGFRLKNGTFTRLNYPGALETLPNAITDNGVIVGSYDYRTSGVRRGFIYSNGKFQSFSDPQGTQGTGLTGANSSLTLVGGYILTDGSSHSFLYKNQSFRDVSIAGASSTGVSAINNGGQITGSVYYQSSGEMKGFIGSCQ